MGIIKRILQWMSKAENMNETSGHVQKAPVFCDAENHCKIMSHVHGITILKYTIKLFYIKLSHK